MTATRPIAAHGPAEVQLALSCAAIGAGSLLLSLQIDSGSHFVGTGFASLGIGAVVSLAALLLANVRSKALPRDFASGFSTVAGFLGVTFVVAGVLAPGGGWMFFEVAVLIALLARRRSSDAPAATGLRPSAVVVLLAMLVFRLWISWQGSEHRWQLMSLPVPILSAIPFDFLAPIQRVSLGEFTPEELGFPPAGLSFARTLTLWSSGFALCVGGLVWRSHAAIEHENDRIHATIWELPPDLAALVERLLPEEEWAALGLHGLSERMLKKRIEALVGDRMRRRRELDPLFEAFDPRPLVSRTDFGGEVARTILLEGPRPAVPSRKELRP